MAEDKNLTKQIKTVIGSSLAALLEVAGDSDIDQGTALDWMIKNAKGKQDILKGTLRQRGLVELNPTDRQAVLDGKLGVVSVTFTDTKVVIKKGADIDAIKEQLGDEVFDKLFETKTTYTPKKTFDESLSASVLNSPVKIKVAASIEYKTNAPRVSFPKAPTAR